MNSADVDIVTRYRSDPDVAAFQDWPMPYSDARALAWLTTQDQMHDVTAGVWVSIAIEVAGIVVGDVAVGLDAEAAVATIGYTLARAHQGVGYASEAVDALVTALFDRTKVHRIVATIDPENHASMRLLEQLGFRYEGTARRGVEVRGEWVDDMSFALLRSDAVEWRARDRARPRHVAFVELDAENDGAFRNLETHRFQQQFVSPVIKSLADAMVPDIVDGSPVRPWFRGITADGVPAGFVMIAEASDHHPDPYLWRLLIDRWHQRRGIGSSALEMLIEQLRAAGNRRLLTSWVEAPGGPRPLYERFGFVPTGEIDDGEVVAAVEL